MTTLKHAIEYIRRTYLSCHYDLWKPEHIEANWLMSEIMVKHFLKANQC